MDMGEGGIKNGEVDIGGLFRFMSRGALNKGMVRGRGKGLRRRAFFPSFPVTKKRTLSERWYLREGLSAEENLTYLKRMAHAIDEQIKEIDRRIKALEVGTWVSRETVGLVALVDQKRCDGCGVCGEICPQGAVAVNQVAKVDPNRCKGCGLCTEQCPQNAIILRSKGI